MPDVEGLQLVVTGATGMAAAAARLAADAGASVAVITRDPDQAGSLAAEVGGVFAVADLTDEGATVAAFASVARDLGRIDGVFAVAGGSGRRHGDGPVHDMSLEAWEETLRINGAPMFLTVREALRIMRAQAPVEGSRGSIVVMGSVLATRPVAPLFATHGYAAAKGAAEAFVRAAAAHYAEAAIRVNGLAPALVETPMSVRAAQDETTMDFARRKQPLAGGMIEAEDAASVALTLLGRSTRMVTGQILPVDAGWGVVDSGA